MKKDIITTPTRADIRTRNGVIEVDTKYVAPGYASVISDMHVAGNELVIKFRREQWELAGNGGMFETLDMYKDMHLVDPKYLIKTKIWSWKKFKRIEVDAIKPGYVLLKELGDELEIRTPQYIIHN